MSPGKSWPVHSVSTPIRIVSGWVRNSSARAAALPCRPWASTRTPSSSTCAPTSAATRFMSRLLVNSARVRPPVTCARRLRRSPWRWASASGRQAPLGIVLEHEHRLAAEVEGRGEDALDHVDVRVQAGHVAEVRERAGHRQGGAREDGAAQAVPERLTHLAGRRKGRARERPARGPRTAGARAGAPGGLDLAPDDGLRAAALGQFVEQRGVVRAPPRRAPPRRRDRGAPRGAPRTAGATPAASAARPSASRPVATANGSQAGCSRRPGVIHTVRLYSAPAALRRPPARVPGSADSSRAATPSAASVSPTALQPGRGAVRRHARRRRPRPRGRALRRARRAAPPRAASRQRPLPAPAAQVGEQQVDGAARRSPR